MEIHKWRQSDGIGLRREGAEHKNWDVDNPLRRKFAYVKYNLQQIVGEYAKKGVKMVVGENFTKESWG